MGDQRNYAALDWVLGEIDETLREARQALETYVENPKDATHLRFCVTHIHQVRGSLQIVEFHGASLLAEEMEGLAQALVEKKIASNADAQEVLMRSLLQLPIYLDHVKVYRDDTARRILPLLNDIRAVRKQNYLTETNLFSPNLSALTQIQGQRHPVLREREKLVQVSTKLREMYQFAAASVLRGIKIQENLNYIEKVFGKLLALTSGTPANALWLIAAALVEGLKNDSIELSVAVQGLLRQLARELRAICDRGSEALDETPREALVKNMLYYIARADGNSALINKVRAQYELARSDILAAGEADSDYAVSSLDPDAVRSVVIALREELKSIKSSLDALLASQLPPTQLRETLPVVKRVADTLAVLGVADLRRKMLDLAKELEKLSEMNALNEDALVNAAGDIMDVDSKLEAIAKVVGKQRDLTAINERKIEIDEAKTAVVRECQVGLEKVKDAIIEYISSQWNVDRLQNIDKLLGDIRGGLSLVPLPRASQLIAACASYINDKMLHSNAQPVWHDLELLADAMASVEYFLERLLNDLDEDAESLLDIAEQSLATLGYSSARFQEESAESEAPASADSSVADDEAHVIEESAEPESELDDEIVEVFIEEAEEVQQTLEDTLPQWLDAPGDKESLTVIRRAYHTLKGSGRMVEAMDVGELAWSVENMLNRVIDRSVEYQAEHGQLVRAVTDLMPAMVSAFKERRRPAAELARAELFSEWAFALADGRVPDNFDVDPSPAPAGSMAVSPSASAEAPSAAVENDDDESEDSALLEIFCAEVATHLVTIREFVAAMERDAPLYTPPTDGLQRALHTLKGCAKMAQIAPIAQMYEGLESFAKELVTFQVAVNDDILQLIRDSVEYSELSLNQINSGESVNVPRLEQFMARSAELRELSVAHLVRSREQEKDGMNPVDPRLLSIFMAEEMNLLLQADTIISQWCADQHSEPRLPAMLEELRTLRRGAEQANLPPMEQLAEKLIGVLETLEQSPELVDEDCAPPLVSGHDALLDMVDAVAAGQNVALPKADVLERLDSFAAEIEQKKADMARQASLEAPLSSAEEVEEITWPVDEIVLAVEAAESDIDSETGTEHVDDDDLSIASEAASFEAPDYSLPLADSDELEPGIASQFAAENAHEREASADAEAPPTLEVEEVVAETDLAPEDTFATQATFAESVEETFVPPTEDTGISAIPPPVQHDFEPLRAYAVEEDAFAPGQNAEQQTHETWGDAIDQDSYLTGELSVTDLGAEPEGVDSAFGGYAETDAFETDAYANSGLSEMPSPQPEPEPEPENIAYEPVSSFATPGEIGDAELETDYAEPSVEEFDYSLPYEGGVGGDSQFDNTSHFDSTDSAEDPYLAFQDQLQASSPLEDGAQEDELVDFGEIQGLESSDDLLDESSDMDGGEGEPTLTTDIADEFLLGMEAYEPVQTEFAGGSTDPEENPDEESLRAGLESDATQGFDSALLDDIDMSSEDFDGDILEVFLEETDELSDEMEQAIAAWETDSDSRAVEEIKRVLHTMKGGARLAGLLNLGELIHDYESFIIDLNPDQTSAEEFRRVHNYQDRIARAVTAVKAVMGHSVIVPEAPAMPEPEPKEAHTRSQEGSQALSLPAENPAREVAGSSNVVPFAAREKPAMPSFDDLPPLPASGGGGRLAVAKKAAPQEVVRVNSDLLEELVNLAGETSISRARLEEQVTEFRFSLEEVDATIERLQEQLRRLDIETQAQILFRQEQMAVHDEAFDPLEMDRYSHLQQLSRSLMESASDLYDLRSDLINKVKDTETTLLQQSRINTTLQEGLMRSRMVPFSRMVPRLRRIVRQVANELGKKVSFELDNVEGELDRSVLERMVPPFEHMLRNAVDHGIEMPEDRLNSGKSEAGRIVLSLGREGSNVVIRLADDGRGIDLVRVRKKAIERGLMAENAELSDYDIMQFILHAGFSTAEAVTQISGRGVGMDVVSSEIKQLGGDVTINSKWGHGTEFVIRLPFTLSVNRALMVSIGQDQYAIPLNAIEGIVRISPFELDHYYNNPDSEFEYADERFKVRYLGGMLYPGRKAMLEGHVLPLPIVLVRTAQHTMALQVDALLGSREIVVKSLGVQFSTVPGLSGATVMGDGSVVVILDPHALVRQEIARADMLLDASQRAQLELQQSLLQSGERAEDKIKTIMVVDDSVTVRKVSSRFLEREGFNVITAKDGVDALQVLNDETPDLMLLDIEMPRMDGFELAKTLRSSQRWRDLPIIMITSRTGEKHREHAKSLGVNRYLGKPYQEDMLIETIGEILNSRGARG